MADENEVLENEAVTETETAASTPEITGDFEYNYSRIENISGIEIPEDGSMADCKSVIELAAMAFNMSNKQTAYNKAAFQKYMSAINSIVGKYNDRISKNEDHLSTHDNEIEELQKLVGNLDLEETTSLIEATQKLVKALFDDDDYENDFEAGDGGIIADHRDRIVELENEEKVTYEYSGTGDDKTHKIAITHSNNGGTHLADEDIENNKTDIYTAAAVDAIIDNAFETRLTQESSSVGTETDSDKFIKGQVETSGLSATTDDNHSSFSATNENFLMSEEAIVQTLNNLINVLEAREATLKGMAENFGKFLATFQLEDARVNDDELFCTRRIGASSAWKAEAPFGGSITFGDSIKIGTKEYTLVKYAYTPHEGKLTLEVSAYIPNGTDSIVNATSTRQLIPLEIFFGGNITWEELTAANGPYQSSNIVYYVTDKKQSYITNGTTEPDIFAAQGEQGIQGCQGVSIKDITAANPVSTESGATNTYKITLQDPANNNAETEKTFTVTNGYGFRYIGTLLAEKADLLPTEIGADYTTAITEANWNEAPSGKSVQINDYVILTDDSGCSIKVFNGTEWQEMIKGVVGPTGLTGDSLSLSATREGSVTTITVTTTPANGKPTTQSFTINDGAQGPQGEQGETGAQGPQGYSIKSVAINASETTETSLAVDIVKETATGDETTTLHIQQGQNGSDGVGINWLGEFSSHNEANANPSRLDAYHNTVTGCSYIYTGSEWQLLTGVEDSDYDISVYFDMGTHFIEIGHVKCLSWKYDLENGETLSTELGTRFESATGNTSYVYKYTRSKIVAKGCCYVDGITPGSAAETNGTVPRTRGIIFMSDEEFAKYSIAETSDEIASILSNAGYGMISNYTNSTVTADD